MKFSMIVDGSKTREGRIHKAKISVQENKNLSTDEKNWLLSILSILRDGGCVRVMADNCLIDIQDIADTHSSAASFYDVYNHLNRYITSVPPIRIQKVVNDYHKLYPRTELNELW